ncbi:MAG: FxsA family protein [Methylocystis sp.]|uniref:FxsA family protein n=1 Tax=Methylocystis sp. TaxID=1911079 RepID=UPI003DA5345F
MNQRTKLVGLGLCLWLALEIVAFAFVLRAVGLLAAIALGMATTAIGLSDVKRLLSVWRERGRLRAEGAMIDGALQALASLLLILPGFASDVAGLALKSPSVRAAVLAGLRDRNGAARAASGPQTIDLEPHEWKHLTKSGRPQRKRRKSGGVSPAP